METLTTTEAAVAAGVSLPQINRVIDERILPDDWYSTSPVRSFRTDACLFIGRPRRVWALHKRNLVFGVLQRHIKVH